MGHVGQYPLLLSGGVFVAGILFWGAFNTVLEVTNNMDFCISCHEMEDNVYREYLGTVHYSNRTGVRATCPDCHVPKEWQHMVVRKIKASNELIHKVMGSIDTPEKFNAKRLELAKHVWGVMKDADSRECRNCHSFDAMNKAVQQSRTALVHNYAQQRGKTCIDCHKGIAHKLPDGYMAYKGGNDEDHEFYEQEKLSCYQCHVDMPQPDNEDWGF
ncbi:MAG: cytochrome C [Gammaproteobacteria bacterium]|nr:cytochrome C [Gammaproteobacteria bacterium]